MTNEYILHFIEYELQAIALMWMAVLYTIKIVQLSRLPISWERGEKKGNPTRGVLRSYGTIFMPWSMESSKTHLWRWAEFGLYHIGALVAIFNTFTFPFAPAMMTPFVRVLFAVLIAPAFVVGILKLIRRIGKQELRIISTPDDYFSLVSLQFFFFFGIMALLVGTPSWRMAYFLITAGFLFYVPFSKISHYIYFFFSRYLTGKRYGWRGVIPRLESKS
ncbi:MAG: hypothetical protein H8E82_00975 [Candidatus Marinimicrobia bacterium]|nr:hypothetical protein [Candidatus Neomarinimicrobiota bacterium]MBL7046616.1 hypothetical protein [Candidatus Neomarinimicrobiota bacterium]